MIGLGESYLVAFGLAAGLSERAAGLFTPVPQLAGAVLGLALPRVLVRVGTVRGVTVSLVGLQGAALVAMALAAAITTLGGGRGVPPVVLFFLAGVYWSAGLAAGPVWNAWVSGIFPRAIRPGLFGQRIRLHNIGVITTLAVGGIVLDAADPETNAPLLAYAMVLGTAGLCRLGSAWFLTRHSEPHRLPPGHRDVGFGEFFRTFRHDHGGRLLVYMLAFGFATTTAVPFFAPYLLRELGFSYTRFMALLATSFVAKALVLPSIGALARRFGARRVLVVGAVATAPLTLLWLVSAGFWWLLVVYFATGIAWAFVELSTFLLLFDEIPPGRRVGLLVRYNLINAAAQAGGAVLGASMLDAFGSGIGGYHALFVLSALLRLASVPLAIWIGWHGAAPPNAGERTAFPPAGPPPTIDPAPGPPA